MVNNCVFRKGIILGLIILLFITPVAFTIHGSSIQIKENETTNILSGEIISNDTKVLFEPIKRPPIFTFNSYIDFDIDTSVLNQPIPIDSTVSVPVIIEYWTDIPRNFLRFIPWPIRNFILFHRIIPPLQTIHLEVTNIPDWATIYFSDPEIHVEIPYQGTTIEVYSELLISPGEDAPCEPYIVYLKAYCDDIGRLNGFDYRCGLIFTPGYNPCLHISAPQFTITPRNQTTVIPINITNCGNKRTTVNGTIIEPPQGFQLTLIPENIFLDISETRQVFLKVKPPNDFIGDEIIPIEFTAKRFPYQSGSAVLVIMYYLVVHVI